MWTLFQCRYCMWNWKTWSWRGHVLPAERNLLFAVCNSCIFRESQTVDSLMETRRQIADLFPRCSRDQENSFSGSGLYRGDVKLYAEDSQMFSPQKPIYAHLLLLAMKSPVFYEMIQSMRDYKLVIKHTSVDLLQAVVKFLYTKEISFSAKDSGVITHRNVLRFSHEYLISDLKSACVADLLQHVSEENLCMVLELAQDFQAPDLKKEAMGFFVRQRRKLKCGTLEQLFRLAHEYELDELKSSCEMELVGKINRRNLMSMLDIAIQGKGLLLLVSTVVFHFLQKDAFGGHGHFSITGSGVDVLRTLLTFGHQYLGFRCLPESQLELLRGYFELDLKERIAVKNLFFMLTLPWQKRVGVFTAGAVRFLSRQFQCLCRTGLTGDILKFAHDYKIPELEKACEMAFCENIKFQSNIFEISQTGCQQHNATTKLMASSSVLNLSLLCTHHGDQLKQLKIESSTPCTPAVKEMLLLSSCCNRSRRVSPASPAAHDHDCHDDPHLAHILHRANSPHPSSTMQAVEGRDKQFELAYDLKFAISRKVFKRLGCFKKGRKRKRA